MDQNLQTYVSRQVVSWYDRMTGLFPAEKVVFEKYADFIAKADVLDLGIGGGRTTAYLADKCHSYTGVDYSEPFAKMVKKKHPGLAIFTADARHLDRFSDASFDFINFSFNGIDYSGLDDRLKIIAEVHRLLKPGGLFFFSTHNRSHYSFDQWPWNDPKISTLVKIKTFIKLIPFISRKFRNQKLETVEADHAIINNAAHSYGLMTFYTTPRLLRRHLSKAGFGETDLYSRSGKIVDDERLDDYMFVVTRKTA